MEKCPGCDLSLPANDGWAQKQHMERHHPEIIAERINRMYGGEAAYPHGEVELGELQE